MKFCQNCGTQNDDQNSFCTKCATPFNAATPIPQQQTSGLRCSHCGSNNVRSEQKQVTNISVKMKPGNGCLWWLLLGWIYLIYVMFAWMIKLFYFMFIGWWVAILKKHQQSVNARTVVHICQNCGFRWETK